MSRWELVWFLGCVGCIGLVVRVLALSVLEGGFADERSRAFEPPSHVTVLGPMPSEVVDWEDLGL